MTGIYVGDAFRFVTLVLGGLVGAGLLTVTLTYWRIRREHRMTVGPPWPGLPVSFVLALLASFAMMLVLTLRTTYVHIHEPVSVVNPLRCLAYAAALYGLLGAKRAMLRREDTARNGSPPN